MAVQSVRNIAGLRTTTGAPNLNVFVEGYLNPGDGGGGMLYYNSSDTTSSDNGATIIVSSSGSRFFREWDHGRFNVLWAGADQTGTNSADTAFATAATLSSVVYFPRGRYRLANSFQCSIQVGRSSFTLLGDGPEQSILFFPTNAGVVVFYNQVGNDNVCYIRDFSITAGEVATGNALTLVSSNTGIQTALSVVENVRIRGDDGIASLFWGNGIFVSGPSSINFFSVTITGAAGSPGSSGNGVTLTGNSEGSIVYNFNACVFDFLNNALVYGAHIQGVTVSNTNFSNCYTGIVSFPNTPNTPIPLDELVISGCQFATTAQNVTALTQIGNVLMTGNVFGFDGNSTATTMVSGNFTNFAFTGNCCIGNSVASDVGLEVTAGATGIITGNVFAVLNTGIILRASTSFFNIQSNIYNAVGTHVSNSGSSNTVGGGSQ